MDFACFALNSICTKQEGFQHSGLALAQIWRCPHCNLNDPAPPHTASQVTQQASEHTDERTLSPQKASHNVQPGEKEDNPWVIGSSPPAASQDDLTPRASRSTFTAPVHDSPTRLPYGTTPYHTVSRALTVPVSKSTLLNQEQSPHRSPLFQSRGTAGIERKSSGKRSKDIKKESLHYTNQAKFNICVDVYVSRSKHHPHNHDVRTYRELKKGKESLQAQGVWSS
jgi:hypothetical protein